MFKHLIVILSLIQLTHCLATRSNIWWSRRDSLSRRECNVQFDNENPSLEGKICGYCFTKCQQQFAACLLAQMNQVVEGSLDYCDRLSKRCEKSCLNDKRTSRVAQANWAKVVDILRQFNSDPSIDSEKKY